MKVFSLILILGFSLSLIAQDSTCTEKEISISIHVDGTLLIPESEGKHNLAIIIGGSGPTDRDGNQNFLKNYSLKKLAVALTENNIATFRYDKRIVKQIRQNNLDKDISFNDFITDAKSVVNYFKSKQSYNKIFIIGHSQGSLVGMLAAKEGVDGFISLAGAGQNIGDVLIKQITKTAPMFAEDTKRIIGTLKEGKTTTDYPQALTSVFNIETQPFMISWMTYNPADSIKELTIPTLLINGTKDLQVSIKEAELLSAAKNNASLKIIENMNHVLFEIKGDDLENSKSYNEPFRKISESLVTEIISFIMS